MSLKYLICRSNSIYVNIFHILDSNVQLKTHKQLKSIQDPVSSGKKVKTQILWLIYIDYFMNV